MVPKRLNLPDILLMLRKADEIVLELLLVSKSYLLVSMSFGLIAMWASIACRHWVAMLLLSNINDSVGFWWSISLPESSSRLITLMLAPSFRARVSDAWPLSSVNGPVTTMSTKGYKYDKYPSGRCLE